MDSFGEATFFTGVDTSLVIFFRNNTNIHKELSLRRAHSVLKGTQVPQTHREMKFTDNADSELLSRFSKITVLDR